MNRQLRSQLSPLPLWQTLEWILLTIVAVMEIIARTVNSSPLPLLFNLFGIGVFAALGRISPHKHVSKIFYIATEFGIILLLGLVGKLPLFALLFVVLIIRNCSILDGTGRSVVNGLTFLIYVGCYSYRLINQDFPTRAYKDQLVPFLFSPIITFGLTILFLQLLVDAITTERKSLEELAVVNNRLQKYALKIEELAILQERNRIAREIHDSLGHTLTVFNFHLAAALRLFHSNPNKAEELLMDVKQLGDSALEEVSRSVLSLRNDPLDGQSLVDAIAVLVETFQQTTKVVPQWAINIQIDLPERYKTAIYRIVQESLTNMRKYAGMTTVSIQIQQTDHSIEIIISDNGKGFELHKNTTGFGLQGMYERVLILSGQLEIKTAPARGCEIFATLPLE